jgi:gliding motility-associated-like protein
MLRFYIFLLFLGRFGVMSGQTKIVSAGEDMTITCLTSCVKLNGKVPATGWTFNWSSNKGYYGTVLQPTVCVPAEYYLQAQSGADIIKDTVIVKDGRIKPIANAGADKDINCLFSEVVLDIQDPGVGFGVFVRGPNKFTANKLPVKTTQTGVYIVEVFKGSYCSSFDTVVVKKDFSLPKPFAGNDVTINCNQPIATFKPTPPIKEADYEWVFEGKKWSSKLQPNTNKAGQYIFKITMGQCEKSDTLVVKGDFRKPIITGEVDYQLSCLPPYCAVSKLQSKLPNETIYTWYDFKNTPITTNLNNTFCEKGSFTLKSKLTSTGCSEEIKIKIKAADSLALEAEASPACDALNNGFIEIKKVKNGVPPFIYSINNVDFQKDTKFENLNVKKYTLYVKDSKGCKGTTMATVLPQENFEWELPTDYTFCSYGKPLELDATVKTIEKAIDIQYLWSDGSRSPKRSFTKSETLWVEAKSECFTMKKQLNIKDEFDAVREAKLFAPNIFNINSEHEANSTYKVFPGFPIKSFQLNIFDRKGDLLFQTNDQNISWDGTFLNKNLPTNVYLWEFSAMIDACGNPVPYHKTGSFQLIKN